MSRPPGPIHPVHAAAKPLGKHSFDFSVSFDERRLALWVDVEDDLLYTLDRQDVGFHGADFFRVFLDGRAPGEIGRGGRAEGVMMITFSPSSPGGGAMKVSTSNDAELETSFAHTPYGYTIGCLVPWSAFAAVKNRPGIIGFDVVQASFDAEGKRAVRMSWTGNEEQERDTARYGTLLLP